MAETNETSPELPLLVVDRGKQERRGKKSALARVLPWLVIPAIAIGGGVAWKVSSARKSAPTITPSDRPERVVGLGTVLPQSGVITVALPFGAGDARIATLKVVEGQDVKAGDVIAILDSERLLLAAVDGAKAQLAIREAMRVQVGGTVQASRGELYAQLARAKVGAAYAKKEMERAKKLYDGDAITAQAYDSAKATSEQAKRDVTRIQATLSRFGWGPISKQADAVVATRQIEGAKADLVRTLADLERAYVRAPIDGTILKIHAEPGEKPATSGVVDLGDLRRMKAEVEVYQTHIRRVKLGARVRIEAPALEAPVLGKVSNIGLRVGRQKNIEGSPAANTDARVVIVTVSLDEEGSRVARNLSNLQITATFDPVDAP